MVEHLEVVFTTDARLLVTAERRMGWIGVVAIGPDAACLNGATEAISARAVTRPDACAQSVKRIIGNRERFGIVLEGCDRNNRAKDFLLENPHLVGALEHSWLNVIAACQITSQLIASAAGQHFRAFLLADVDITQDLFKLFAGSLRTDHRCGIQRIALNNRLNALQGPFHELVIDFFMDQRAAWAGTDFALIEREHHKAFDGLIEEIIIFRRHIGEEDVWRFAAQFQCYRNEVLAGILHDETTRCRFTRKGNLGNAWA